MYLNDQIGVDLFLEAQRNAEVVRYHHVPISRSARIRNCHNPKILVRICVPNHWFDHNYGGKTDHRRMFSK